MPSVTGEWEEWRIGGVTAAKSWDESADRAELVRCESTV